MKDKKSEEVVKTKQPYVKPTVRKLTPEEAKLKLLGAISEGDEGAKELLEKMFPEMPRKKSA